VEGVFALPPDLFADEELAELASGCLRRREIVLAAGSAPPVGPARFVQGRSASACRPAGRWARASAFSAARARKLVLSSAQLEILDGFAGAEHSIADANRRTYGGGLDSRELAGLRDREGARERDLDLLRFELAEIDTAAPHPDEEDELRTATGRRERLAPPPRQHSRRSRG